jgi:hypothetical protein
MMARTAYATLHALRHLCSFVLCTYCGTVSRKVQLHQGMLLVWDPRPSIWVLGRVLGSLKYPATYSSNVEFSPLV